MWGYERDKAQTTPFSLDIWLKLRKQGENHKNHTGQKVYNYNN